MYIYCLFFNKPCREREIYVCMYVEIVEWLVVTISAITEHKMWTDCILYKHLVGGI